MEEQGLALLDYGPDEPAGALEDLRHSPVAVCTAADQFGLHALSRRPPRRRGEGAGAPLPLVLQGGQSCAQDGSGWPRRQRVGELGGFDRPTFGQQPVGVPCRERIEERSTQALVVEPGPCAGGRIRTGGGSLGGRGDLPASERDVDLAGQGRQLAGNLFCMLLETLGPRAAE